MLHPKCYPPLFGRDFAPEDPLHPEIAMQEIPSIDTEFNRMITSAESARSTRPMREFGKRSAPALPRFRKDKISGTAEGNHS